MEWIREGILIAKMHFLCWKKDSRVWLVFIVSAFLVVKTLTVTSDFSFPAVAIKSTVFIPLPFFTLIVSSFNVTLSLKEGSFNVYETVSSLLVPSSP